MLTPFLALAACLAASSVSPADSSDSPALPPGSEATSYDDTSRGGPQEAKPPTTEPSSTAVPVRRRVVQTAGGGVLRGRARLSEEGAWQIELDRGWTELPGHAVDSVELEADLLDEFEAKKKSGALAPADLLEWTLDAGLLKEAFELGDRLIADFPRDMDLRSVAAGRASRYVAGMPERGAEDELEGLRNIGSKGSPFVAEAVVERLAIAAPRAEVLKAVRADLAARETGRRSFGALALGRLFPTEDPRPLLLHAMYDPAKQVRRAAALGLADMGATEVCGPLVKALDSRSAAVRKRAVEALGETRESLFVEPLMDRVMMMSAQGGSSSGGAAGPPRGYVFIGTQRAYVQDFDVEVAAGQSIADPVVNTLLDGAVLGAGVISLETTTITLERRSVLQALRQTAGLQPGRGQLRDWRKWWDSEESQPFKSSQ